MTAQMKKGGTGRIQEGGTSNAFIKASGDVYPVDCKGTPEEDIPDTDDDRFSTFADNGSDGSYIHKMDHGVVNHSWTWTISPATIVVAADMMSRV